LQHWGVSIDAMLDFVRGKVAAHFNYVAAVSGSGGAASSAPWRGAESTMTQALRTITGCPFASGSALKQETGTWDQQTRIDMLSLRFWCKILASSHDGLVYRAMCLSLQTVTPWAAAHPATANSAINVLQQQSWMQHIMAACGRFGLPLPVLAAPLWHGLVDLQADVAGTGAFCRIDHPDLGDLSTNFTPPTDVGAVPMRLVLSDTVDVQLGVNCWNLPPGTLYRDVFRTWGPELRAACYTALRMRANRCRQLIVRSSLTDAAFDGTSCADRYHSSSLSASHKQPYLYLLNPLRARRMLQLRLGILPTEECVRERPHRARNGIMALARIPERSLRACYCCPPMDDTAAVFHCESLPHVLLRCSAYDQPRAVALRALVDLTNDDVATALAQQSDVAPPDFVGTGDAVDTALFTAMRLCMGTGPVPPPSISLSAALPPAEAMRAAPVFCHQHNVAVATSRWISALMSDWDSAVRNPSTDTSAIDRPGYRLAAAMSAFVVAVFSQRRHLLATSSAFQSRSRDPVVAPAPTLVAACASSIPMVPMSPGSLTPTTQPRGPVPGAPSLS
jgi:hypothetical protein